MLNIIITVGKILILVYYKIELDEIEFKNSNKIGDGYL